MADTCDDASSPLALVFSGPSPRRLDAPTTLPQYALASTPVLITFACVAVYASLRPSPPPLATRVALYARRSVESAALVVTWAAATSIAYESVWMHLSCTSGTTSLMLDAASLSTAVAGAALLASHLLVVWRCWTCFSACVCVCFECVWGWGVLPVLDAGLASAVLVVDLAWRQSGGWAWAAPRMYALHVLLCCASLLALLTSNVDAGRRGRSGGRRWSSSATSSSSSSSSGRAHRFVPTPPLIPDGSDSVRVRGYVP